MLLGPFAGPTLMGFRPGDNLGDGKLRRVLGVADPAALFQEPGEAELRMLTQPAVALSKRVVNSAPGIVESSWDLAGIDVGPFPVLGEPIVGPAQDFFNAEGSALGPTS